MDLEGKYQNAHILKINRCPGLNKHIHNCMMTVFRGIHKSSPLQQRKQTIHMSTKSRDILRSVQVHVSYNISKQLRCVQVLCFGGCNSATTSKRNIKVRNIYSTYPVSLKAVHQSHVTMQSNQKHKGSKLWIQKGFLKVQNIYSTNRQALIMAVHQSRVTMQSN